MPPPSLYSETRPTLSRLHDLLRVAGQLVGSNPAQRTGAVPDARGGRSGRLTAIELPGDGPHQRSREPMLDATPEAFDGDLHQAGLDAHRDDGAGPHDAEDV